MCRDPLKVDACFKHVVERRGGCLCVRLCVHACVRGKRGTQVDDIAALRHGSST